MMNGPGKSDRPVIPEKSPNNTGQPAAEGVEGSGLAKRNLQQQNASRTPSREDALSALDRCRRSSSSDYYLYGARGIQFLFDSFEQFYAELGPRPSPKHSLDRVNNDGHYEPGNVRWATAKEQASNKRKPDVKDGKNPNARVNDHTVWWIRGLYAVGRYRLPLQSLLESRRHV